MQDLSDPVEIAWRLAAEVQRKEQELWFAAFMHPQALAKRHEEERASAPLRIAAYEAELAVLNTELERY